MTRAWSLCCAAIVLIAAGCSSRVATGNPDFGEIPDGFDVDGFTGVGTFESWGCATASGQASRVPVYMHFVLDGSGSMDDDNKWTSIVPALHAIFDDLLAKGDPSFGVGLKIFADEKDPTIGDFTAGPYDWMDVPIGFMDMTQHMLLLGRLDGTQPYLGTPTYEVLSGQFPLLAAYTPTGALLPGGRKVMVFITDGVPDPDMPAGVNEVPWSLDLVLDQSTASPQIATFAVGIGNLSPPDPTRYDPLFMGQLAMSGGVARPSCDPNETMNEANMCHFQITPGGKTPAQLTQEFVDTINAIRLRSLSCEYPLDRPLGQDFVDPALINVVYTPGTSGAPTLVQPSMTNGWSYDDPTTPTRVILHGAICDTVKADDSGKLEIVLGCKTIIL